MQADHGLVVAQEKISARIGADILKRGGNAIDAGVAGGIALGVLQSDIVGVAGVAPTLIYLAERDAKREVARSLGRQQKGME